MGDTCPSGEQVFIPRAAHHELAQGIGRVQEVRTRHVDVVRVLMQEPVRGCGRTPCGDDQSAPLLVALVTALRIGAFTELRDPGVGDDADAGGLDLVPVNRVFKDRGIPADLHARRPHVERDDASSLVMAGDDRRLGGLGGNECACRTGDQYEVPHICRIVGLCCERDA